jgi:methylthioribose-1-phosphate isomerase
LQGTVDLDWSKRQRSVYWEGGADATGRVMMVEQRFLPAKFDIVPHSKLEEVSDTHS